MTKRPVALVTLAAALLAGCGGGGDDAGGGTTPPTNDFNARAAWQRLIDPAALRTWSVSGRGSDGATYDLGMSVQAGADATFPLTGSTLYSVGLLASSIDADGVRLGTGLVETFYDAESKVRGLRNTSNVLTGPNAGTFLTCDEIVSTAVPPVATKANTSGTLYTSNIRQFCVPGANIVGTSTTTWSVEYDGFSATMFFCIRSEERGVGANPEVTSEKDCVEIDANGTLSARGRARVTLNSTGFSLEARNY